MCRGPRSERRGQQRATITAGLGLVVVIGLLVGGRVIAQDEAPMMPTATTAAESQDVAPPAEAVDTTVAELAPAGTISLDFHEADIRNVLRIFAEKSGVNVVAGDEVQGKVTIRLLNVPWEQALNILLKTYGLTYERDGNVIRVTTFEQMNQEELETGVFVLNYAKAADVVKSLADVLTERGTVREDARTNMLVVRDIPTNLYRVRQVVERLDRRTPQVAIDTKIVEITLDRDENLGIDWTIKVTAKGIIRPTTLPFRRDAALGTFGRALPPIATSNTDFPAGSAAGKLPFAVKGDFTFGTLDFSSLQAILEILKTRTDTSIVSNPRITTLNNQEAIIHVGEIFNVPTFERNSDTGTFEVTGFEERDIGINLRVTPHVNEAGEIVVDLHPEVTDFSGFDSFGGDLKAPRFDTREAQTQVRVGSGQTVAIGGLVKDKFIDVEKKVPLLGDVPFLGALFRKTEQAKNKTDLIFFITVTLLEEGQVVPTTVGAPSVGAGLPPTGQP